MLRISVFDHLDSYLFDIDPNAVVSAYLTEEVNGQRCLDLLTAQKLSQGMRLVFKDGTNKWHEHVVIGNDENHDSGRSALGNYHAIWSMQYDLTTVYGPDVEVGGENPAAANVALPYAVQGTTRWQIKDGPYSPAKTATIEMFGNCAWERLGQIVDTYGGEIDAEITHDYKKITSRKVVFVEHVGSSSVTRRFDWGHDLTSIRRKPQEVPLCCRIIPIGTSDDVNIYDLNAGYQHYDEDGNRTSSQVNYLEDGDAALAYRMKGQNNKWEYPTRKVKFDIDDDRTLLAYATEHLTEYTRPTPTYEATVMQYAAAGMNVQGVAVGDVVHIVDKAFCEDGLREEGRVVRAVVNLLDQSDTVLTIGQIGDTLTSAIGGISSVADRTSKAVARMSTSEYLDELLDRINDQINATGGYAYIVPGQGIITYDKEVSDPLTGALKDPTGDDDGYADQVTQIKGGSMRFATEKKSSFSGINDWDWRTTVTAGSVLVDSATIPHIDTGYIGAPPNTTGNFWNLDSGELHMEASSAKVGNETVSQYVNRLGFNGATQEDVFKRLTGANSVSDQSKGIYIHDGELYINATLLQGGILQVLDSGDNIVFMANMTTKEVNLAGFTAARFISGNVTQGAIYNGPNRLGNTTAGVYVGTDGIQSNSSTEQVKISDGKIEGYQTVNFSPLLVGTIDPTAVFTSGTGNDAVTWRGLQLRGNMLDIRATHLMVLNSNSTSGTSEETYSGTSKRLTGLSLTTSSNGNEATITPTYSNDTLTLGMVTGLTSESGGGVTVAAKNHTHGMSGVDGLSTALNGKANSQHSHGFSDVLGLDSALNGKSSTSHNHDGVYAPSSHNHDSVYAPYSHTHDGYAASDHSHSYSEISDRPTFYYDASTYSLVITA